MDSLSFSIIKKLGSFKVLGIWDDFAFLLRVVFSVATVLAVYCLVLVPTLLCSYMSEV